MRKTLAMGCCALYLVFGFVAGAAHVHESADHHAASQGLHLDHVHLGDSARIDPAPHDRLHDGDAPDDSRHVGDNDEDVLYLSALTLRSLDSSPRLTPGIVSVDATIDPPAVSSGWDGEILRQPRDPPRKRRSRPRAPPA